MRAAAGARRGVTMPLVCIMLTALVGATALAVDIGRMYYSAAEVQTAADAAALAAARTQEYNPAGGLGPVLASAQAVAALNASAGQPIAVQSQDVVPATYDPTTRAIGTTSWSQSTAAFTVTAQARVPSIMMPNGRMLRRTATAWIANINGASCVRPIAINYTRFYESGVTYDTRYSGTGTFAPDFVLWDIGSTHQASLPGRTVIVLPPNANETDWATNHHPTASQLPASSSSYAGGFGSHANWEPVDNYSSGLAGFTLGLQVAEGNYLCPYASAAVGDVKQPLLTPTAQDQANLIAAANTGMQTLCNRHGNTNLAYCLNADGSIGVKTRIMLTDSVVTNGTWTHKVRDVGRARIMCYFQSPNDVCPQTQMNEVDASGNWCYFSSTDGNYPGCLQGPFGGYPAGTIMMFLDTPGSMDLGPDVVLGTKPALTQRVLLAK